MPRQHRSVRLQSRDARGKLTPRKEPYWHDVERGRSVGYYRGTKGGAWLLREHVGGSQRYVYRRLGRADDINEADGATVLSFTDAVRVALREDRPTRETRTRLRVEDALDEYFEARRTSSPSDSISRDRIAAESTIVPGLGDRSRSKLTERQQLRLSHSLRGKLVCELTTVDLRRWRDSLIPITKDPEKLRSARARANRVWSILRAALNHAFNNERVGDDRAWRRLTPFRNVDQPQTRFLRIEECRQLISAASPALRPLVQACLFTGLRLGELLALNVSDVGDGHVTVRHSKTGKSRRIPLNSEGSEFFKNLVGGKGRSTRLFGLAESTPRIKMQVSRRMRDACKAAKIDPPVEFRQLRTSYGSLLLNADAPLSTISELLGHKDTRMTRRHYAHLMSEKLKETVDQKLPSFVEPSAKLQ
jgi:integrase